LERDNIMSLVDLTKLIKPWKGISRAGGDSTNEQTGIE